MATVNHQPGKARATIKTVADLAGVSVPAVSKVLRNAYGVSDQLRQKVEKAIAELGYRPNMAARAMRGSTSTIGILLVEIANPFLQQIVDGANEVLVASGYKALFGVGQSKIVLEASLIESMISHQMDGLMLVSPQLHGDDLARYAEQIPMVVIGHHEPTAVRFDTVNSDDQVGAGLAVKGLLDKGHREIAMLSIERSDTEEYNVDRQREIGYRRTMAEAGLARHVRVLRLPFESPARLAALIDVLRKPNRPRALFCWSDLDAVRVLEAAKLLGIRVPENLAVVGYDNSSVAQMTFVDLASVDQAGHRIGATAIETLFSRIRGRSTSSHLLIKPSLNYRASMGG